MTLAAQGSATVRVPATSANLGPGFDALGLALAIYDDVRVQVVPAGLQVIVEGEGAGTVPSDESHLVIRAIRLTLDRLGARAGGLVLRSVNHIPHGRGLGSSAAAICAGVLLGRALVRGAEDRLDADGVLTLAAEIEGHPDNVAACLRGGMTVAWTDGSDAGRGSSPGRARACRLEPMEAIRPVVFIAPDESSTVRARGLLPATVSHVDAAFNAARSALLVAAVSADSSVLLAATADRLHQPYRAAAMPDTAALVDGLRGAGLAALVSGAGPSVLALTDNAAAAAAARAWAPPGWRVSEPGVDRQGALVRNDLG